MSYLFCQCLCISECALHLKNQKKILKQRIVCVYLCNFSEGFNSIAFFFFLKVCVTSSHTLHADISGLKHNVGYHIRISARNEIGTSSPLQPEDPIVCGMRISEFEMKILFKFSSCLNIYLFIYFYLL